MQGIKDIEFKIDNTKSSVIKTDGFFGKLKKLLFIQKFNNATGIAVLVAFALIIATGVAKLGIIFAILILAMAVAAIMVYALFKYPTFGIILVILMAYNLFMLMRIGVSGPVGLIMDSLQLMLVISMLVSAKKHQDWDRLKGAVSVAIGAWIIYNFAELVNPSAESRLAWVYTIRSVAIVLLSYFVFLYYIRTIKMVRLILKVWLLLALFAALYGYKQEYIGFSAVEDAYLHSDPAIASLLFIGGHWRKFSIFSDPVAYAYNMVMPSILCICIIAGKFKTWQKVVCAVFTCLYLHSMLFSGTRGANVLLPAALVLFGILNFNRNVLIFTILSALFLVFLINVPTGNPNLQRFQTAFRPNNDDSYKVRKANQKRIQPFILSHPMGGGLGATGTWGKRFAPGSMLSQFPPDSGYIRVAVEMGWLGLLFFCTMVFTILKTGINYYFKIKNPELRTYCLALTMIIFAYNIANFPQEALVQYPSNILFSVAAAMITVCYRIDRQERRGDVNFGISEEKLRY